MGSGKMETKNKVKTQKTADDIQFENEINEINLKYFEKLSKMKKEMKSANKK